MSDQEPIMFSLGVLQWMTFQKRSLPACLQEKGLGKDMPIIHSQRSFTLEDYGLKGTITLVQSLMYSGDRFPYHFVESSIEEISPIVAMVQNDHIYVYGPLYPLVQVTATQADLPLMGTLQLKVAYKETLSSAWFAAPLQDQPEKGPVFKFHVQRTGWNSPGAPAFPPDEEENQFKIGVLFRRM